MDRAKRGGDVEVEQPVPRIRVAIRDGAPDVSAGVGMEDVEPTCELKDVRQHAGHLRRVEQVDGQRQRTPAEFGAELAKTIGRTVNHHHAASSREEMARAFEADAGSGTSDGGDLAVDR